jgi:hypothetical protein
MRDAMKVLLDKTLPHSRMRELTVICRHDACVIVNDNARSKRMFLANFGRPFDPESCTRLAHGMLKRIGFSSPTKGAE